MAKRFSVNSRDNALSFKDKVLKGAKVTYEFNFSQWAEENNTATSATWEVEHGKASVSGQSLANNIASALVSFPESGASRIKLTANTGTEQYVTYLDLLAKETDVELTYDYGLRGYEFC